MTRLFELRFGSGRTARAVRVEQPSRLGAALRDLGLPQDLPTLALIGGAARMTDADVDRVRALLEETVVPVVERMGGAIVDGGTDCGVVRAVGEATAGSRASLPLVGVVPAGLVRLPGRAEPAADRAPLEPHHTHFVLAPGDHWGDESVWLSDVTERLAGKRRSVTLLVNGGPISRGDVRRSIGAGRPVIAVRGSGRLADELARAPSRLPGLEVVDFDVDRATLGNAISDALEDPIDGQVR